RRVPQAPQVVLDAVDGQVHDGGIDGFFHGQLGGLVVCVASFDLQEVVVIDEAEVARVDLVREDRLGGRDAVQDFPGRDVHGPQVDRDLIDAVLRAQADAQELRPQAAGSRVGVVGDHAALQDDGGGQQVRHPVVA